MPARTWCTSKFASPKCHTIGCVYALVSANPNRTVFGSQDNTQRRILSAVRGRLRQVAASLQAAVRFRRFSRRGTTAPDWFVDKSHQEDQDVPDVTTRGCWGYRVVFDPALPIYYKVSHSVCHLSVLYNSIWWTKTSTSFCLSC